MPRPVNAELPPTFINVGTLINDRYRVERFLGAGGFAAVYHAEDVALGRPVAIKILTSLAATPDPTRYRAAMTRFRREAMAMAQIRHPNVVTIHDVGVTEELGQPFIVMELLDGHDLDAELNQHGPFEPERGARLLAQCLEALQIGHDKGVVHKDLKPSNLFVCQRATRSERLRLLDFGIARLHETDTRLTHTGQIMGTPQYLAPEYIRSQIVSPALDVYQMGLLMCEMFTGQKVISSENPITCALLHRSGDLSVPERLLKSPLGPVITRALALDHRDRYPNAGAFAEVIGALDLRGVVIQPGGPTHNLKEVSGSLGGVAVVGRRSGVTGALPADDIPTNPPPIEERVTIEAPSVQLDAIATSRKIQALKRTEDMAQSAPRRKLKRTEPISVEEMKAITRAGAKSMLGTPDADPARSGAQPRIMRSPPPSSQNARSGAQPALSRSGAQPALLDSSTQPALKRSNAPSPTSRSGAHQALSRSGAQPALNRSGAQPSLNRSGAQPALSRSSAQPAQNRSGAQSALKSSGSHPSASRSGAQPALARPDAASMPSSGSRPILPSQDSPLGSGPSVIVKHIGPGEATDPAILNEGPDKRPRLDTMSLDIPPDDPKHVVPAPDHSELLRNLQVEEDPEQPRAWLVLTLALILLAIVVGLGSVVALRYYLK